MRYFLLFLLAVITLPSLATVNADFNADRLNGCPPLLSNFTNASTNTDPADTLDFRWDFSNGNVSTLQHPSAIFQGSGTYRVRLIATGRMSQISDTVTKSVIVFRVPQANFQAPATTVCLGDTFYLNSNVIVGDAPITDYAWGFGNGVASSDTNPFYVYTQPGLYDVTLVIQDGNTCSISQTRTQYVNVVTNPSANFTATPAQTCATSQLVTFTNLSTGNGLTYLWNLTNTVNSTDPNPTYTYSDETYNVLLTVTDIHGCKSMANQYVVVDELEADFMANKTEVCTGEQIYFANLSNFSGYSTWDFGNGGTSGAFSPYYDYSAPGYYTVKLTQSFAGCTDVVEKIAYIHVKQGFIPSFATSGVPTACNELSEITFTNTTAGTGLHYAWMMGDGSTSTDSVVQHTYQGNGNFTVTLTVTDDNGCIAKVSSLVPITTFVPAPDFVAEGLMCRGGTVNFANKTAEGYALFNAGYGFVWTFGDGDTSFLPNPTHVYRNPGTYTVSLTVYNTIGCDSTMTKPAYITIDTVGIDFSVSETFSPCPPFVSLFTSTSNQDNLTYNWSFGDGNTDTAQNPTHIYFHPGIFTVTLDITTTNGCRSAKTYPHLIEVQGPFGIFAATPTSGCIPLTVDFMASVSDNTKNMWCDLGDGNLVADSAMFQYTYTTLGTYNPKFILVDHVGCTVPYDLPAIVTHLPAPLQVNDTAICAGNTIQVNLAGTDAYHWDASDDISCDTCSALTIVPSATHNYIVSATNQYCTVSDTMHVFVDTIPVLTPFATKVCVNSQIELFAGDAYRISWSPAQFLSDTSAARPLCTPLDTIVYDVVAYNSLGCSSSTQVAVTTIDKLDVNAAGDVIACAFDSFSLATTMVDVPDAPLTYSWTPAGYLDAANVANPVGSNLMQSTSFQVVVGSENCVSDTATIMVTINNLPDLQVSEPLTTSPYAEVKLWASSMQDLSYQWTAADSLSCGSCRITNLYPGQTQMVHVTGTNQFGCKTTDSVQIRVMACDPESVFLPNVFTPNGDGLNDEFAISSKVLTSINYFRIFDEWGSLLFETKNINEAWDGKVGRNAASTDVFVYLLQGTCANGGDVLKYGNITLVK